MPAIPNHAKAATDNKKNVTPVKSSANVVTPQKRRLRSNSKADDEEALNFSTPAKKLSPPKRKSPRRAVINQLDSPATEVTKELSEKLTTSSGDTPLKKPSRNLFGKSKWNPSDPEQVKVLKEAFHVSTMPCSAICREFELSKILDFCKVCVEGERSKGLYICGCPGTGKSMVLEKVQHLLTAWSMELGLQQPDILSMDCTKLTNTSEIFVKILQKIKPQKKSVKPAAALKQIQDLFQEEGKYCGSMLLLIIDEVDFLITKDRSVLHELFMLTILPFSKFILIGIANAIDLAERFLPKLRALNCKPEVVTFPTYSKDQILKILQQRTMAFPGEVFQPQALELCARRVAASASSDMRKALNVCRSAVELLEAEMREKMGEENLSSERDSPYSPSVSTLEASKDTELVRVDHMAMALSKVYKSCVVETIQSLPQHQQMILCSAFKHFSAGKKEATIPELNKSYTDLCKLTNIPSVGILELTNMCRVLNDQGLLKVGMSRKVERVTMKVDADEIKFALQTVRFFKNCLQ